MRQFHSCPYTKWQMVGAEFRSSTLGRATCILCGLLWPSDNNHRCRQLSHFMLDVVGLPSVPNPTGPGMAAMAKADAHDMLKPGLAVLLFMQPPTSEEVCITNSGLILMHPVIIASDKEPRTGLGLYTVAGLDPQETRPQLAGNNATPLLSRAVLGPFALASRTDFDNGVPHMDLLLQRGTVNSISVKLLSPKTNRVEDTVLPPVTPLYFPHHAHGTKANALVRRVCL